MIEAPENVYPHNCAIYIDKTQENDEYINPVTASFTFNGDNLSFVRAEYYLADTNAVNHYAVIPKELVPWRGKYRRGDTFSYIMTTAAEFCENGLDYTYRYILFESEEDGTPKCSMKALAGRITSASGTRMVVENNISDIDEPYIENGYLIGCCKLKIYGADSNGKYNILNFIKVNSYNPATGEISLDSALTGTFKEGDRYEIYRNYYKTPMYFFKARANAELSLTVEKNSTYGTIACSSDYNTSNADNVSLMYYFWQLGYNGKIIDTSKDIYSYHKSGSFPSRGTSATLDCDFPYLMSKAYTLTCNAVSQDGAVSSESTTIAAAVTLVNDCSEFVTPSEGYAVADGYRLDFSNGLANDLERRCIRISFSKLVQVTRYSLFRRNVTAGETDYRLIETKASAQANIFFDRLVDEDSEYEYVLYGGGTSKAYKLGRITASFIPSCTITGLTPYEKTYFGAKTYDVGEMWHFDFEISDPDLLIHNRKQLTQTQKYPLIGKSGQSYISADFSAAITQLSATGFYGMIKDTASLFESFKEFITGHNAFILQLPGTPCMVVDIGDEIKLKKNSAGLTVCSFSFIEIADKDDVFLR